MAHRKMTEESVETVIELSTKAQTPDDLHELLHGMAYAIGGLVCHFESEDRSSIIISLTQALGLGLQNTAKNIGEPSTIEIIVGGGNP